MSSNALDNPPSSPTAPAPDACRVCGGNSAAAYLPAAGDADTDWPLLICPSCAFVCLDDAPVGDDIAGHYPPEYYGRKDGRFTGPGEAFEIWCRRLRAGSVAGLRPPGAVLDIGCGRGIMLAALRDRGWQATGTEVSDHAAEHARDVLGLDVHVGDLAEWGGGEREFDVVTLWHVLEHVPDPRACLEQIRDRIKPDGLLIVSVPNLASLEARLGGRHWFHMDLPRHVSHFSLRTLTHLLQSVGFTPVRTKRFSLEYGPYGMLQTLLNRMGFPHNLLYNALKAPGARLPWQSAPWRTALQLIATVLLLPVLAPLSVALHLLDGLAFGGSCIEVHAIPTNDT